MWEAKQKIRSALVHENCLREQTEFTSGLQVAAVSGAEVHSGRQVTSGLGGLYVCAHLKPPHGIGTVQVIGMSQLQILSEDRSG